jgi:tetratricopeptide (TPR) repeat protein
MRPRPGARTAAGPSPRASTRFPTHAACALALAAACLSAPAGPAPAAAPKAPAPIASASPAAVSASPKPQAPANLPCAELLAALPTGASDPSPYLPAAACLRRWDSTAALNDKGDNAPHSPLERGLKAGGGASGLASDSILRARLPSEKLWFMTHMERLRVRRDFPRMLDMAYLTEAKGLADAEIFRELAAVYLAVSDVYRTGLCLLRQGDLDSTQTGYIQYQLESLLHNSGSDVPATDLLDSLTARYPHRNARTAEILEGLCWNNRDYPAAYRNLLAMMSLKGAEAGVVLERIRRLQSLGYFDFAAALLDKLAWRKLGPPWLGIARTQYLQIRSQLQDWTAVTAEAEAAKGKAPAASANPDAAPSPASGVTGGVRYPPFGDEEIFLIGSAFLKLGMAEEALARARKLEEKGEAPWGFRGRLLKAQALMALGKPKDAAQALTALKKDPKRQEGTGPILFWQGCLALDQGRYASAESLMVLASAYTGAEESQRALEYRFFMLLDTGAARPHFFRGLPESPHGPGERGQSLDKVGRESPLWPFAQLEKAQIHLQNGDPDSAEAVFDAVSKQSPDRLAGFQAEAKAAFTAEKLPGGRQAALARYEDLLIKYQQGVIPEFSRGRIKALR